MADIYQFDEAPVEQMVPANVLRLYGLSYTFKDLVTGIEVPFEDLRLAPFQFTCLGVGDMKG